MIGYSNIQGIDVPNYVDVDLLRQRVDNQAVEISVQAQQIKSLINLLEAAIFPPDVFDDQEHMEDTFHNALDDIKARIPVERI